MNKVLIIGAGRMGIRHLQGALQVKDIEEVTILDVRKNAIDTAKETVAGDNRVSYGMIDQFVPQPYDICIVASTAGNRKNVCELAQQCGCKYLMIEKPLGQSYNEVEDLILHLDTFPFTTVVNLNMRMYDPVLKLKRDLLTYPQLYGEKVITLNTGTLGIGCNGIHYLDFVFFILNANRAEIVAAEVNDDVIPSGRGADFCDFGGWAMMNFFSGEDLLAKVFFSMSSKSTVFGGWEIVAPYGRIIIDEIAQKRTTVLRKEDSQMPLNRYAADYLPYNEEPFVAPFPGDLTAKWISELLKGVNILPKAKESLQVHQLMFNWLSHSKTHHEIFPIT